MTTLHSLGGVTDHVSAIEAVQREHKRALNQAPDWPADFEAFVRKHSSRLVKSLALITLDRGLAEDAAQEAFLQLYLHWDEVSAKQDPGAWLFRVGMNRCKNCRRALGRAARLVDRLGRSLREDGLAGEWSPEIDFVTAFKCLPNRQRTAIALRYLAGFSTTQIAQAMGISEGAVGSHLHKARASLRRVLEAD
jgi:RNA polymerase sigma factor (sigma-70 family)